MGEPADIIAGYHHTGQVDTDAVNDMARRVTQARNRVIEAAKEWRKDVYEERAFGDDAGEWIHVAEDALGAAVDALEEAERNG